MTKELLFSVTAKDCNWSYSRGSGPGGQKRNKTNSKVHCHHPASGALAVSDKTRSQHLNKRDAFAKMIFTTVFKRWHRIEIAKHLGTFSLIEEEVDKQLRFNTHVEVRHEGRWVDEKLLGNK